MARKKLIKNDIVKYDGIHHIVEKSQYIFRGVPVVDLESEHGIVKHIKVSAVSVPLTSDNELTGKTIKVTIPTPVCLQEQPLELVLPNKYQRTICEAGTTNSLTVDVYDVLEAFKVTCPALQHLAKKALCVGIRGHKDTEQDLKDIIASAQRALQLHYNRMGI
jgi:hypothetical protein